MPLQYCLEPEFLLEFISVEELPGLFILRDEIYKRVRTDAELSVYGEHYFVKRTFEDKNVFWFEVVDRKRWEPELIGLIRKKGSVEYSL